MPKGYTAEQATVAHWGGGLSESATVKRNNRFSDLSGQKFGRLTVTGLHGIINGTSVWVCCCECGKIKNIKIGNLKNGHTRSCGCLSSETTTKRSTIHGKSKSGTYNSWASAKQRCFYEKSNRYLSYGSRGIVMCEEWKNSFDRFYKDMGDRPAGMSLERKDNDKGYEPGNCKWATNSEQQRNKRNIDKCKQ